VPGVWDVLVIGGGPAGSSCAGHASRNGLSTLIIDKARFPRDKPCGGGLSLPAARLVEEMIGTATFLTGSRKLRARGGGRELEAAFGKPFVYQTTRQQLDNGLMEWATGGGAEVMEGVYVGPTAISRSPGGFRVAVARPNGRRETVRARFLVGADGVFSIVRRCLSQPFSRKQLYFCTVGQAVPKGDSSDLSLDEVLIDYGVVPRGYAWAFPKGDYYNVGTFGPMASSRALIGGLDRFCSGRGLAMRAPKRGAFIAAPGFVSPAISGDALLVGDAAGFADPLTGEGLRYAIMSGKLAAEALIPSAADGSLSNRKRARGQGPVEGYAREARALFGQEFVYARLLAWLYARLPRVMFSAGFREEKAASQAFRLLTGEVSYRRLVGALIKAVPSALLCQIIPVSKTGFEPH